MVTANAEVVQIKSKFRSEAGDPFSFIKKQLTYNAFREAISIELEKMGLESKQFWQMYDEKFAQRFAPVEQELRSKYKIDSSRPSGTVLRRYEKDLREARLSRLRRFGGLSKAISQFSVKKISRSTSDPNIRYMRMSVKVNRRVLHQLYLTFASKTEGKKFQKITIEPILEIENGTWADLGVSNKALLESALAKSWLRWFEANFSSIVNEVALEGVLDKEEVPQVETSSLQDEPLASEEDIQKQEVKGEGTLKFKIFIKIDKTFDDPLESLRDFNFSTHTTVIDLSNGSLIAFADVEKNGSRFQVLDDSGLSSATASAIYNLPLNSFTQLKAEVLSQKAKQNLVRVKHNHFPVKLVDLKHSLEKHGIALGLEAKILKFGREQSLLEILHNGDQMAYQSFISRLNQSDFFKDERLSASMSKDDGEIDIKLAEQIKAEPSKEVQE